MDRFGRLVAPQCDTSSTFPLLFEELYVLSLPVANSLTSVTSLVPRVTWWGDRTRKFIVIIMVSMRPRAGGIVQWHRVVLHSHDQVRKAK